MCLLEGCASRADSQLTTQKPDPAKIQSSLSEANGLFAQRSNIGNLRRAVAVIASVRNPDHRDFDVEWQYAKYCYFLGKAEKNQDKAAEIFERGRDAARIAARIEPERPDGHFWFAANLGELSRMSPLTVGLKSVDDLRESLEKVIAIEPGYQGASAYDALGQLEMATRNFKGGKTEKAVEYYEKGVELSPINSNTRLHLAEAYFAIKRDRDARDQIETIISMKPDPEYAAEHQLAVAKAKELLSKNF